MYFFGLGIVAWTGVRWNPDEEDAEALVLLLLLLYEDAEVEEFADPKEGS
jgi:hypothetical protein